MNDVDDAFIFYIYAEFEDLRARFTAECEVVESAEFRLEEVPGVEEARSREQSIICQWQSVFQQIATLTTHTKFGALAKILVLQQCLEDGLATNEEMLVLVKSLARDLDTIIHDDPKRSCSLRFSELPTEA